DSTAPEMPKNVVISEDGTVSAAPPNRVAPSRSPAPDGKPLGSGKADGEGHFTLPLVPAQTNGEQVTVTATDSANNVSPPTTAQAPDITARISPLSLRCWTMLKASPGRWLTDKPPMTTAHP
ncbi:Ig-like domain-containing protein, partial [Salmonella enterica]|uniref:Ig-like domain-containing protein n=1 Tax=Salmonella enterica TaxID=28901 RepID=UPI00148317B7